MYGRPPFDSDLILKMEIISYFYKLSERQVGVLSMGNYPPKSFWN